ncbi:class C sortase [Lacticaseibacillus camelliae]|uniref:class C sortase n=1 Tax=Lacticaseibacillus camelliae TaxID=381742 RepID=UPI0006D05FE5|nr:class C sortase [Lacticaseibacillus camelliae]
MSKRKQRPRAYLATQIIAFLFLIFGAAVALYPFYVGGLNDLLDNYRAAQTQRANQKNADDQLAAMRRRNAALKKSGIHANADPFSGLSRKQTVDLKHDMIGDVIVPKLKLTVPLFKTLTEATLQVGAAVVPGTSMPVGGPNTHTVIAGHRGLVDRRLFSDLNRVKKGDLFVLKVFDKHLAYKVFRIQVVKPDDTDVLRIEAGKDLATLLTCTPYMINSHRLLITGHRVPYTPAVAHDVAGSQQRERWQQLAILLAAIGALFVLAWAMGRRIHTLLLRRHVFNLLFYRVDLEGHPVSGAVYQLCKKNGKPLYRQGKVLEVKSDETGQVFIEHLPGGVYLLKELAPTRWRVKVGKKKTAPTEAAVLPEKKVRLKQ